MEILGKMKREDCLFVISVILLIGFVVVSPSVNVQNALAQEDPLEALEKAGNQAGLAGKETNIYAQVGRMVKIVLSTMGLILIIMLIIAGVNWMTSGGNEDRIKKAKLTIRQALIGLAIVVLAYTMAHFVVERFEKVVE